MSHEKVDEQVEVLVKFKGKTIFPAYLKWRDKTYKIEKLNMVHREKAGEDKVYYFSCSDSVNFFRLSFSTRDLSWKLEEIYCD